MATPRFITEYWRILTGQDIAKDPEDTQLDHGTLSNPNNMVTQVIADETRLSRFTAYWRFLPSSNLRAQTDASLRQHAKDLAEPFSYKSQLGRRG